jgi:hypothetical protein
MDFGVAHWIRTLRHMSEEGYTVRTAQCKAPCEGYPELSATDRRQRRAQNADTEFECNINPNDSGFFGHQTARLPGDPGLTRPVLHLSPLDQKEDGANLANLQPLPSRRQWVLLDRKLRKLGVANMVVVAKAKGERGKKD